MASDAVKVAEYRSALRLRSSMLRAGSWSDPQGEAAYKNFSRILSKASTALLHLPSARAVMLLTETILFPDFVLVDMLEAQHLDHIQLFQGQKPLKQVQKPSVHVV